jgi:hypothetical protein
MFYWFKRGGESLRYESREVSPTRFELTIIGADGIEHVEHFETPEALHDRQVALERELLAQGWVGPHGWNV